MVWSRRNWFWRSRPVPGTECCTLVVRKANRRVLMLACRSRRTEPFLSLAPRMPGGLSGSYPGSYRTERARPRPAANLAKKMPLKDVAARGEAETRNRLCPVPTREGRMGGIWLSPCRNLGLATKPCSVRELQDPCQNDNEHPSKDKLAM